MKKSSKRVSVIIMMFGLCFSLESLQVYSQEMPVDKDTYLGGNKKQYAEIVDSIVFKFSQKEKVRYDEPSNAFLVPLEFGSKEINSGVNRYLEFGYSFSSSLSKDVVNVNIKPSGVRPVDIRTTDGKREFSYRWTEVGRQVGGKADSTIYIRARKIMPGEWISVRMQSNRNRGNPVRPAWNSVRVLPYAKFGVELNTQLLDTIKSKAYKELTKLNKDIANKAIA